uniref:Uncharacterized protein n=1 Tax=Candidatus Kentrum sp. FM TaxID=2126340 RepID=A0A450S9G1_9GAMM|nr:MAG: hypothetical protein BECKFM1743A_GA0114220_1006111 [Candidatus Kentron sp. FM]VFJ48973.1 MAG: hypothetical protein BECKFM1743C_GA0114222_1006511 [Candidatus Kentron sp. FM]VFK13878.1 MAG: hypothetical protein BECKFM1743B_GA0114221_102972 [Candidatus Kentron sp. FM]
MKKIIPLLTLFLFPLLAGAGVPDYCDVVLE